MGRSSPRRLPGRGSSIYGASCEAAAEGAGRVPMQQLGTPQRPGGREATRCRAWRKLVRPPGVPSLLPSPTRCSTGGGGACADHALPEHQRTTSPPSRSQRRKVIVSTSTQLAHAHPRKHRRHPSPSCSASTMAALDPQQSPPRAQSPQAPPRASHVGPHAALLTHTRPPPYRLALRPCHLLREGTRRGLGTACVWLCEPVPLQKDPNPSAVRTPLSPAHVHPRAHDRARCKPVETHI